MKEMNNRCNKKSVINIIKPEWVKEKSVSYEREDA